MSTVTATTTRRWCRHPSVLIVLLAAAVDGAVHPGRSVAVAVPGTEARPLDERCLSHHAPANVRAGLSMIHSSANTPNHDMNRHEPTISRLTTMRSMICAFLSVISLVTLDANVKTNRDGCQDSFVRTTKRSFVVHVN